jgi:hypothetical protein
MQPRTAHEAAFTAEQVRLLIELLEGERRRLPVEIRHTYRGEFKEHLRRRLELAEALLERLKACGSAQVV